jgi:hypothetical protein
MSSCFRCTMFFLTHINRNNHYYASSTIRVTRRHRNRNRIYSAPYDEQIPLISRTRVMVTSCWNQNTILTRARNILLSTLDAYVYSHVQLPDSIFLFFRIHAWRIHRHPTTRIGFICLESHKKEFSLIYIYIQNPRCRVTGIRWIPHDSNFYSLLPPRSSNFPTYMV